MSTPGSPRAAADGGPASIVVSSTTQQHSRDSSVPFHLHHIFGLKGDIKDNIQYVDESEVLYGAGHNIIVYNMEKKSQRFIQGGAWAPNDMTSGNNTMNNSSNSNNNNTMNNSSSNNNNNNSVLASSTNGAAPSNTPTQITAIAVSNSKVKYLAIAEKGERAHIWIYDLTTHKRKLKQPLVCSEMTSKEFISLSFSADGKHLLAQGGAPDWTLVNFMWDKNKPLQIAQVSNQTGASIYQCSYCPTDPTCVCVTGNGILRFLRLEQSEFKSIQFSIGKREPQNYLCHTWVDDRILVGTDTGDILVFENAEFRGVLASSPANGKSIDCIATFSKGFVCGCDEGVLYVFERDEKEIYRASKSFQIDGNFVHIKNLAISPSEDNVICTLENNQAFVLSLSNTDILKAEEMNFEPLAVPFHSAAITGLDVCIRKPLVVTCSADKSVRVWNYIERSVEAVKYFPEKPCSVAFHPTGLHLLVGFTDSLRFINLLMDEMRVFREFNVKNCREVRFSNGGQYFAVANSTVLQVFTTFNCELLLSFRDLKARIRSISWSFDDSRVVFTDYEGHVIELKVKTGAVLQDFHADSKGVEMFCTVCTSIDNNAQPALVSSSSPSHSNGTNAAPATVPVSGVSTGIYAVSADGVLRYIESAKERRRVELEGLVLTQLALGSSPHQLLYAGSDNGSLVSFELPLAPSSGTEGFKLYTEYMCHSGAITRMRISPDDLFIFTASEDGSLAIFELDQRDVKGINHRRQEQSLPWAEEILVTKSDLEEKMNIVNGLKRKVEELQHHNQMQLRERETEYQAKLKELTFKFTRELDASKELQSHLDHSKTEMEKRYKTTLEELEQRHAGRLTQLQEYHTRKMQSEEERLAELERTLKVNRERWAEQKQQREEIYVTEVEQVQTEQESNLAKETVCTQEVAAEKDAITGEFEDTKLCMEDDADKEADELKASYDSKLAAERMNTLRLKDENSILKRKFSALNEDIKEQKENIKKREDKQRMLYEQIRNLEKDVEGHLKEIQERESTIGDKLKRIFELRKKNQELEKFKFVLDYKIKELKRQILPRQKEIKQMSEQIQQMDAELQGYKHTNNHLQLDIKQLNLKVNGMQKEISEQEALRSALDTILRRARGEINDICANPRSMKSLKEGLKRLYHKQVAHDSTAVELASVMDSLLQTQKQIQAQPHVDKALPSRSGHLQLKDKIEDDDSSGDTRRAVTDGQELHGTTVAVVAQQSHQQALYVRQRNYLEKSIDSLKTKMEKELNVHRKDNKRINQENIVLINEVNRLRKEMQLIQTGRADAAFQEKTVGHVEKAGRSHSAPKTKPTSQRSNQLLLTAPRHEQHEDDAADKPKWMMPSPSNQLQERKAGDAAEKKGGSIHLPLSARGASPSQNVGVKSQIDAQQEQIRLLNQQLASLLEQAKDRGLNISHVRATSPGSVDVY